MFATLLLLLPSLGAQDLTGPVERLQKCLGGDRAELAQVVRETYGPDRLLDGPVGGGDAEDRTFLREALVELVTAQLEATVPERVRFVPPGVRDEARGLVSGAWIGPDGERVELEYELTGEVGTRGIVEVRVDGTPLHSFVARFGGLHGEALLGALRSAAARYRETPVEVVERLQAGLMDAMMRADELGYAGRVDLLGPLVRDTHDLEAVLRLVARKGWDEADADARAELTRRFAELAVATYAARFDGWSGERFEVREDRPTRRGGWIVEARLSKKDGKPIAFEYQLHRATGRWTILNIVVDGVSDLAIKRAEFSRALDQGGVQGLLAELQDRIRTLEAGGGD